MRKLNISLVIVVLVFAGYAMGDSNLKLPLSPVFATGPNPFSVQCCEQIAKLQSESAHQRGVAAEALGYLRFYGAQDSLITALKDTSADVRRQAAISLAWCGSKKSVGPLLEALGDKEWSVAQAASVSLNNITAMVFDFDALAKEDVRKVQIGVWRNWWNAAKNQLPGEDILRLLKSNNDEERLRAVRAIGALGIKPMTGRIEKVMAPFLRRPYEDCGDLGKHLVQSCIRTIGRLKEPKGFDILVALLDADDWARYAADALADYGDRRAVAAMIEIYPEYSRILDKRQDKPLKGPRDDNRTGNNTQDRMLETPFMIASALMRLPLDETNDIASLRRIVPYVLANFPSDWDSGVFYHPESDQLVTAYLLEKAQIKDTVAEIAFAACGDSGKWLGQKDAERKWNDTGIEGKINRLARRSVGDVPDVGLWLVAFCSEVKYVPQLIELLDHQSGWIRINAAKTLMFIGDNRAIEPIAKLLADSKPEAQWGFSGALEHAEYDDPAPRWREAFVRALGRLGAKKYDELIISFLDDDRCVLDVRHAAAIVLDELATDKAIEALKRADRDHPFHSVRMVAREALWRRGIDQLGRQIQEQTMSAGSGTDLTATAESASNEPDTFVFIKGNNKVRSDFNGQAGVDPWRQTYAITNSGPAMRIGRNLYILRKTAAGNKVTPLTSFKKGFVADCEVSWDATKVIFARRLNDDERNYKQVKYNEPKLKDPGEKLLGGGDDPWWQIWEINVDGTDLRQITSGPYHHVAPVYLGDGRILCSSSHLGTRDEYHGYPCVGLCVMNADGSDLHTIGFNVGADRDPAVLNDGRIVFSRLDIFYSRLKTEVAIHTMFPDGTRNDGVYGPERRAFWKDQHTKNAAWTMRNGYRGNPDNRNRVLRLSQPQPFGTDRFICASSAGLVIVGPGRYQETMIPHPRKYAVTSPYPIGDNKILCAATIKQFTDPDSGEIVTAGTDKFLKLKKGPKLFNAAINIDLGLYTMDFASGEMTLLYNDPGNADFEARPIIPRKAPITLAENPLVRTGSFTATLFCNSARISRHERVRNRGKFIRLIEGQPVVSRHQTQNNRPTNRWKNHGGTIARILGTMPLAADGSFFIEVPADRLLQLQVLDSDRRVLANQTFWMYARPGEIRSCVGCHEKRDTTTTTRHFAPTAKLAPIKMLPFTGDEFSYQAKAWMKGIIPDEVEDRTRTVHAINLLGRN